MISVSNEFKEAMQAPVKMVRASVAVSDDEIYTSSNDLVSISYESSGYYFGVTTKALEFSLLGVGYDLLDKNLEVMLETCISEEYDYWESCNLGKFVVVEQTSDLEKETTKFKCYDTVGMMAREKYSDNFTFPCTIAELVDQFVEHFSLDYETQTLVNGDYEILEDPYSDIPDITFRDILSEIAGATASNISIDGAGNTLSIKNPTMESGESWTYDNLKKISFGTNYGPINAVVLARTPVEDNIALRDDESITEYGLTELKLANNEILDDDRESLIEPILTAVDGFSFYPFEATTEGHGWHQCGDRILVSNDDDVEFEVIITDIKLTLDGGIKETIKGVRPEETDTDYALAGGITKTIYNTQIKVDKQNQKIQSVVEGQTILEGKVNDNYTEITQNITNVITSVQNSGGNNLLKNSAMYSLGDDGLPLSWTFEGTGDLTIAPSAEAAVNGSLSRQNISLRAMKASQTVEVKADNANSSDKTYYSFSCKIKKTATGSCYVKITDGTESGVWLIELENGEESFYRDYSIEAMLPNSANLTVSVFGSSDSEFSVTDMMLSVGDYKSQWTQANGEFANTQVSIDSNGVVIRSSTLAGTYTKQTPQEISTYSHNTLSATVNDDGVIAPKAEFKKEIGMSPIKIVPQSDGWAFVKKED